MNSVDGVLWELDLRNKTKQIELCLKKGVLGNFAKFTWKRLCQSLFFNKVADLRSATLLKKRLCHRCFHVNFAKFLRTPISLNTSGGYFWNRYFDKPNDLILNKNIW